MAARRKNPELAGSAAFHADRAAYHRGAADAHAAAMKSNPRKGTLGTGYTKRPAAERRKILASSVAKHGYTSTMGILTRMLPNQNIKLSTRRKVASDVRWLMSTYGAFRDNPAPAGLLARAGRAASKHGKRAADEAAKALVPVLKHAAVIYGKKAVQSACAAANRALDNIDEYEPTRRKKRKNPNRTTLLKPLP